MHSSSKRSRILRSCSRSECGLSSRATNRNRSSISQDSRHGALRLPHRPESVPGADGAGRTTACRRPRGGRLWGGRGAGMAAPWAAPARRFGREGCAFAGRRCGRTRMGEGEFRRAKSRWRPQVLPSLRHGRLLVRHFELSNPIGRMPVGVRSRWIQTTRLGKYPGAERARDGAGLVSAAGRARDGTTARAIEA